MIKKLWNWFKDGFDDGYRNEDVSPQSLKEWMIFLVGGAVGFLCFFLAIHVVYLLEMFIHGN